MYTPDCAIQTGIQKNQPIAVVETIPPPCVFKPEDASFKRAKAEPIGDLNDLARRIVLRHATRHKYDVSATTTEENIIFEELLYNAPTTRKRLICRSWPRDSKGKAIRPENSQLGKMTSNDIQFWGATLWDFYYTHRFPDITGLVTTTTGSKLAKWMRMNGETEHAQEELAWADMEEDPREVDVYDIAKLIKEAERMLHTGAVSTKAAGKSRAKVTRAKVTRAKVTLLTLLHSKLTSLQQIPASVFDRSAYPAGWPLEPFTTPEVKIEKRLPLHLLPKRLIIHDPWNLLSVTRNDDTSDEYDGEDKDQDVPWSSKKDIAQIYELEFTTTGRDRVKEDEEAALLAHQAKVARQELRDSKGPLPEGYFLTDLDGIPLNYPIEPPVYVVHNAPSLRGPVPEAHLYISPAHAAGKGNHSMVYNAEWELPRDLLVPEFICRECALEDAKRILEEEDGPNQEKKAAQWMERSGRIVEIRTVHEEVTMGIVHRREDGTVPCGVETDSDIYVMKPGRVDIERKYVGPIRFIKSTVQYQNLARGEYCKHVDDIHPLTARVRVAAKLSIKDDDHLKCEGSNYQSFPRHFFEHWNGFNIVVPLLDPTPVGAVVPQFYGFYVPTHKKWSSKGHVKDKNGTSADYLSPILLMEDCGKQVDPSALNIDDSHECASLLFRFHHGGWLHDSVYARNFLYQAGPLTAPPEKRMANLKRSHGQFSFRLIDFGRSGDISPSRRAEEEMQLKNMLGLPP
ncbi:hypothetical protein BDQ12DRAFT_324001 [Crucibulum laeve]|uniref:Protein kinase domain-containing protein n=1 Tax=Crucibulum laeve TaxID=68775 RepID=A0A5C3LR30_9AGAR|nr:hypothetical protein BDQ12DRAFT_324001 [Crucibulum laeve]